MGQIEKRRANSYRLGVSCGFDSNNKRIMKYKTIKLESNLTEKQIQQELTIQLDKFEKEVEKGTYLDGNITLNEFSEKWIKDYAETNLKPKTFINYQKLLKRVLVALGHKKLDQIQPTHLLELYKNLTESKIRLDYKYKLKRHIVTDIPNLRKKLNTIKISKATVSNVIKGGNTSKEIAGKVCALVNMPISKVFDTIGTEKTLSSNTISHYHKLISAMLTTAVQWQLITANPAERVKPPKIERKEAKYYDIEEVTQMLTLLEEESIKYRTMIHVVIFCGLRLGELTNLDWSDIDFDKKTISISKQLQYLPEFGVYELESTKSDSGNRTLSIPSNLTELLQKYKIWQQDEKIKWDDKWIESEKLFT